MISLLVVKTGLITKMSMGGMEYILREPCLFSDTSKEMCLRNNGRPMNSILKTVREHPISEEAQK